VFVFGGLFTLILTGLLIALLPESIRFLASKRQRMDLIALIVRRMLPGKEIPTDTQFVVADEGGQGRKFTPSLLFAGALRFVTPLLWVSYVCSSLTTFCISTWTPLVFEALKFSRTDAAWAGSGQSLAGMIAALLLMRFTDKFGSISITIMPLFAVPVLLIAAFGNLSHNAFFMFYPLVGFFVTGAHNGMHSIAGIFYPSSYRSNGTGWASAIAKIGATAGPMVGAWVLSSGLPTRQLFAVLAIAPAVMTICVFTLGLVHRRILGREALEAPTSETVFAASSGLQTK
jgi:AAHS family 4-hydroxybenzoate transporter-like MFS transporter